MQQDLSAARVVDPVLTNIARSAYALPNGQQFVADVLFPRVTVQVRAGTILSFGKEDFMSYTTVRSPGAKTDRIQFGFGKETFSIVDHSLEGMVPIELQQESLNGAPGINQSTRTIRGVQRIMELSREVEAATLARNISAYGSQAVTLTGTHQWNGTTADADPFEDVFVAREAIRAAIGVYPNVMVIGPRVYAYLKRNPAIMARITPNGAPGMLPNLDLLAAMFEVDQIIVGRAVSATDAGTTSDVWGRDVILAYTTPDTADNMGSPNFGYTYQLDGYPYAEEPYFGRNEKTWYFPYTDARRPYLVGPSAGYLIKDAVAA